MFELSLLRLPDDIDYIAPVDALPHLAQWGLSDFIDRERSGLELGPLGVYLRGEVVVGLQVCCTLDAATRKVISALDTLEILDLYSLKGFSNPWMGDLAKLPRLKRLDLRRTSLNDKGLEKLSASTSLEQLDIRNTKVNEDGFSALGRLTQLQCLRLTPPPALDFSCLEPMSRLTRLKILDISRSWNQCGSAAFPAASIGKMTSGMRQLETLYLDYSSEGRETGLDFLDHLPELKHLSIRYFTFDDASINALQNRPQLQSLDISSGFIQHISQANHLFHNLGSLQALYAGDFFITSIYSPDAEPKPVSHIPKVYLAGKSSEQPEDDRQVLLRQYFPGFIGLKD